MGTNSNIEWTDHTFNPWQGCTKDSAGCKNCYAIEITHRFKGDIWGPSGDRPVSGAKYWEQPARWDRKAAKAGQRAKVFCASMADVFEGYATMPQDARLQANIHAARLLLWQTIEATPNLDWLLLTKRPQNVNTLVPEEWLVDVFPDNVWIGTSVEDQKTADRRIPELLGVPCNNRFLSCEPLLEKVSLVGRYGSDDLTGCADDCPFDKGFISWVIVGGESGLKARPFDMEWASDIVRQLELSKSSVFIKQLGDNIIGYAGQKVTIPHKGSDWSHHEYPEHLKIREFPEGLRANAQ